MILSGKTIYNAESKRGCLGQCSELEVVTQALLLPRPLSIYTDNEYIIWVLISSLPIWARNGLITANGKPVRHQEVLTEIWGLIKDVNPSIESISKVKAHTKN